MNHHRRDFVTLAGLGLAGAFLPHGVAFARGKKPPLGRVVVIGGGFAGATAAKYIRLWSQGSIEVVVVETNGQFVSCPMSNLVLGGHRKIDELTFGYALLQKNHGITWVNDTVTALDTNAKKVLLQRGELQYDRLVIAPGIDFMYENLPMLASVDAQKKIPHAWKAGWQTVNLRQQLEAMQDGGVFIMHIPKAPYRCPPGPYERACQVAFYFKQHKAKSKVIILDANGEIISKKALFAKVFNEDYAGIVDYQPNQNLVSVDVTTKTVKTEFESFKADVLNIIPPQRAGKVAQMAGLNNIDDRWCEVDFLSYASTLAPNVHVIGDATSAGVPKSAHIATSQAKVCASAIVQLLSGLSPDPAPVFANTCYSFVNDVAAMHVANVYRYDVAKKIMVSAEGGGVSKAPSVEEGEFAVRWGQNILADTLS